MPNERRFRRLFRLPVRVERVAGDIDDELHFHIEMRAEELRRRGMSESDARAEALRQFGDVDDARRYCREMDNMRLSETKRGEWWSDITRDVKQALRSLARRPGFTTTVIITLALGIGANVTMFGIVDRILLRPPAHVVEPSLVRRVYLNEMLEGAEQSDGQMSYPQYQELAARLKSARSVAAFYNVSLPLGEGDASRNGKITLSTSTFFPLLGVHPTLGRFFTAEEDLTPRGEAVAVLSHRLWERDYGASDSALGKRVVIAGRPFRVIGVAPSDFTDAGTSPVDAWVPMSALAGDLLDGRFTKEPWYQAKQIGWLRTFVRLPNDAARLAVEREGSTAFRAIMTERHGAARADSARPRVVLEPINLERGSKRSATAGIALWLAGMSGVVLLIACANVANLLLARAISRRREIALRVALGAGRGRLVRQLLVEALLLATAGGVGALALAQWGGGVVRRILLPNVDWGQGVADPRLLITVAAVVMLTAILTGLVPALQASTPELVGSLKSGAREGGGQRGATRRALVAAQAALSVVLLVAAGLFLRSLQRVQSLDLGYDADQVLSVNVDLVGSGIAGEQMKALYDRLLERVSTVPGVRSAALSIASPFSTTIDGQVALPGRDSLGIPASKQPLFNAVTPDYFTTLGTRIVRGRGIEPQDKFGARPVVVVNELMARTLWPNVDPIGQCVILAEQKEKPCVEVVGIARGVVWNDFREEPHMQLYVSMAQKTYDFTMRELFVRANGDPAALQKSLRAAVRDVEPLVRNVEVRPLARNQDESLRPWRLGATLFTVFGALALVLATLGLYAVIAYGVTQRVREMGVRVALGAAGGDIVRLILGEGVRVAAVGVTIGMAAAIAASHWLGDYLFGISPRDPLTFGAVALVLLLVSVVASLVPALRATRVAPGEALRAE